MFRAQAGLWTFYRRIGAAVGLLLPLLVMLSPPVSASPSVVTWDGAPDGGGSSVDANWSTPSNWVGDVAPVAGDDLVFPNVAAQKTNVNDFPAGTAFASIVISPTTGASNYVMSGNRIVLGSALDAHVYGNQIGFDITLGGDVTVSSSGTVALNGAVQLNGHTLTLTGSGSIGLGPVSGSPAAGPGLVAAMSGTGVVGPVKPSSFTGGTRVDSGALHLQTTGWPGTTTLNGGRFTGIDASSAHDLTAGPGGGTVDGWGSNTGIAAYLSTLTLNPASHWIAKATFVAGSVDLGDASLDTGNTWCAPSCNGGLLLTLVRNTGSQPVRGTFAGLPDHARFQSGSSYFEVSYTGGDGNDVTVRVVDGLTQAPPSPPVTPPSATSTRSGYWMVGATGTVYAFGAAPNLGSVGLAPGVQAVDIEATPSGNGYWVLTNRGDVYHFGDAQTYAGPPPLESGESVTAMSSTASGLGYWLFTSRGHVLAFGDAQYHGDMGGTPLVGPVLGSARTPSGGGYYMVASDGGIFTFGDAAFHGSMGGRHLNGPVVGLTPDPDESGYWLVASDGGVFTFDAPFRGSMGSTHLNQPIIGMVAYGDGYLMVASDGGIFDFSDKAFAGSLGNNPPAAPIVGVAALN